MTVFNLGSLNIDRVLSVEHIVQPGETLDSRSLAVFAGGKGANQSIALARAGAQVAHIGKVGPDGTWLIERLQAEGVDTRWVRVGSNPTGQAMIQVDVDGQNAIVLLGGANREITRGEIDEALATAEEDAWLLVQNETSAVGEAIECAKRRGLQVAFNPAPFAPQVLDYPAVQLDLLCLNETEAAGMVGTGTAEQRVAALAACLPKCEILLTLGSQGVLYRGAGEQLHVPAKQVAAVDTTAAGDTFLGYYLAGRGQGLGVRENLERATAAAALCVTRAGAMDSIPRLAEVVAFQPE